MAQGRQTLMDPPIEDLLDKVDSKFTLVALGSARARQVNSYYNSLGEGLGKVVPSWIVAATGMATNAPIRPRSVPPINVAIMVNPGLTLTVCFITRGFTR